MNKSIPFHTRMLVLFLAELTAITTASLPFMELVVEGILALTPMHLLYSIVSLQNELSRTQHYLLVVQWASVFIFMLVSVLSKENVSVPLSTRLIPLVAIIMLSILQAFNNIKYLRDGGR